MGEKPSYLAAEYKLLEGSSHYPSKLQLPVSFCPCNPTHRIKSAGILAQARITCVFLFILVGSWFSYVREYSAVTKLGD